MNKSIKWNEGWQFSMQPLHDSKKMPDLSAVSWQNVNLPHDYLIGNTANLYQTSEGWYIKKFSYTPKPDTEVFLYFEGVYMDSAVFVNGRPAGEWKYGYSSFDISITDYLVPGNNTVFVRVRYESPNSRWYSGAGIYRSVWFNVVPSMHIIHNSIYIQTEKKESAYEVTIHSQLSSCCDDECRIVHSIEAPDGTVVCSSFSDETAAVITKPVEWSAKSPYLYTLHTRLIKNSCILQEETNRFGLRTTVFDPERGFFINGVHTKLNGVCMHHDLGCLGSAVNRSALRRQLDILAEMGVNAIRTSHNMPAPELLELADEMGFYIMDEAFDMWERSKTTYDYARFFKEWSARDVKSWICRDRNHPSVILWSIGNEIYDTHADEHGQEITRYLMNEVLKYDPYHHAEVTVGSNYMTWENAQHCADIYKIAGYNYTERLYEKHHRAHPDWVIYGSETYSIVQSRGIYHFPLSQPSLSEDDGQCSSLGNSTTSWGAKSLEACILAERDTPYSLGQFLWSGFDYIGEPTPYHSRNSFFGVIDTAGFKKDSFYLFQSAWTDYKKKPMVHILPYWDFNPGQLIDIRVFSNAPCVELFLNGISLGRQYLEHKNGTKIIGDWQTQYVPGTLRADAYDENNHLIATETVSSFDDAYALRMTADRTQISANGQELAFITIEAIDKNGNYTANANNYILVEVTGEGVLAGLDNGDSTDPQPYKGCCKALFSGKLLAVIAPSLKAGKITVKASSKGLKPAEITIDSLESLSNEIKYPMTIIPDKLDSPSLINEVPVRKLELVCEESRLLTPEHPEFHVKLVRHPSAATCRDVEWKVTAISGVAVPNAEIKTINDSEVIVKGISDGSFYLRCSAKNNRPEVQLYSQLEFSIEKMGTACYDPYTFISGSLYDFAEGNVTNGNEHGAATSPDSETSITFTNLDFGAFGSASVEIPIFELASKNTAITFIEGKTRTSPGTVLGTYYYNKKSIWNVYQPQVFTFPHRLKGVNSLTIVTTSKIHIKGFQFIKEEKAFSHIYAVENDGISGDAYTITDKLIKGIGNNVALVFNNMDFKDGGSFRLAVTGHSPIDKNTIHVRMSNDENDEVNIAEFKHTDGLSTSYFTVNALPGVQTVTFLFLPGSNFDFESFQFEQSLS